MASVIALERLNQDTILFRFCQRIGDWLFSTDPGLRVRSSMAMLAVLLMVCSAGVMLWIGHAGYGAMAAMVWWSAISIGGLVVVAALIRTNVTRAWSDPALTFLQILWGVSCSAAAYVLAGEAKGVVPSALAVTLLFAALNLNAKQIVAVSLYALLVYAAAIAASLQLDPRAQPAMEIGYAGVIVTMLMGCMFLSLRLYELRMRLRNQRQDLALALEENRELASKDPLTGLLNRRHMLELLHLEQRRCQRGVRSMLIAQIDIDHFKDINDTYGHHVGDVALQRFANQVRQNIRSSDVLSRWGGEEFVLLLSDSDIAGALHTLNRVRLAVQNCPVEGAPPGVFMTVSMGLAQHIPGESVELTLDRADRALYRAKRAGRNQVVLGERPTVEALNHAHVANLIEKVSN